MNREKVNSFFAEYTGRYNIEDPKIKLKLFHTYRVAAYSQQIAESLHLPAEDVDLAWLIGMLHDVGRFEQVRRYNTFFDSESVDHAQFGADLLFKEDLFASFFDSSEYSTEEADDIAYMTELAIRNHNKYRIDAGLTEREILFCNIIRDADKVDIIRVNVETPVEDILNVTTEEIKTAAVTPQVLDAFYEEHAVLRNLRKTPVDHLVGHASLVFELVYPESRRIIAGQKWLWELLAYPSDNPETVKTFAAMRDKMQEWLRIHTA